MPLDLETIKAAHERIRPYIKRTPVLTSGRLDRANGARLFFKCENFQKIGAFKARGATNAVFVLDDAAARRGVATHSSGNHGTALAPRNRFGGGNALSRKRNSRLPMDCEQMSVSIPFPSFSVTLMTL